MAGFHGRRGPVGPARRRRSPGPGPRLSAGPLSGGATRELAPLLLTSPTVRSGSTLLQRLLCSSDNALVYGEEIGKDLELQLQIFASRRLVYSHSRQRFADGMARVLRREGQDWLADLMPDLDAYLDALHAGAYAGLASCRQHALQAGRTLWGFKYPGWAPHMVRLLCQDLPRARVVYIHRELAATARSAKAWGAIEGEAGMQAFCAQWLGHLRFMRQWQREHAVLMLSYEDLVGDPAQALARLRGFAPIEGMDPGLLEVRINNLTQGLDPRHGHNDYIPPASLSAQEQAWVDAAAATAAEEA